MLKASHFFQGLINKMAVRIHRKKYDMAFRRMATHGFAEPRDFTLSENDIVNGGNFNHKKHLFLGVYPISVIEGMLKKYRVREYFEEKGIYNLTWHINMNDPFVHRFILLSENNGIKHKLIELVLQIKNLNLPVDKSRYVNLEFLHVEWLMMQNPYKSFADSRPALPGQKNPGLGVGLHMLEILFHLAKKTKTHGLINSPNYLHTALFFSRVFRFMDPKTEAFMQLVKYQLLPHYNYYTLSWADEYGALQYNRSSRAVNWRPATMISPITPEAKRYFYSRDYRVQVRKNRQKLKLQVNMKKLTKKLKERGQI